MAIPQAILPKVPMRVMDLVKDAGIDVSDWGNYAKGAHQAASKPQNTSSVSAISMERCPRSAWNSVGHQRGMLSAIRAERCPRWRGIRTCGRSGLHWSPCSLHTQVVAKPPHQGSPISHESIDGLFLESVFETGNLMVQLGATGAVAAESALMLR